MPTRWTRAEIHAELQRQLDRDPEEANDTLRTMQLDPLTLVAMGAGKTQRELMGDSLSPVEPTLGSEQVKAYSETKYGRTLPDDAALLLWRAGVDGVTKVRAGISNLHKATTRWRQDVAGGLTRGFSRAGNVLEMVFGTTEPVWRRGQQATLGLIAGESLDDIKNRVIPEVYGGDDVARATTPFMLAGDQLTQLFLASVSGNQARVDMLMDKEPLVLETMAADLNFEDAVIGRMWGGDEQAYNDFIVDQVRQGNEHKLASLALTYAGGEVFADPLWATEFAPMAVSKLHHLPKVAKQLQPALKSMGRESSMVLDKELFRTRVNLQGAKEVKIEEVEGVMSRYKAGLDNANQELAKDQRVLPDLLEARKKAEELLDVAQERVQKDVQNPDALRDMVIAEKRVAEVGAAIDRFKQIDLIDIDPDAMGLRTMPRFNPDNIKFRGRDPEDMRRQILANEIISEREVTEALRAGGFKGISDVEFKLKLANEHLTNSVLGKKGSPEREEMFKIFNDFARLPEPVKEHLDLLGISRTRILRKHALQRPVLTLTDQTELDTPLLSQRATLGPDDAEAAGQAAKHLVEGGDPADVTVYGANVMEYSMLGHGSSKPRFVDDRFVRFALNPNKIEVTGTLPGRVTPTKRVYSTSDQLGLFADRNYPGLVEGSTMVDPWRVVTSSIWMGREPTHALRGTGIASRLQAATGDWGIQTQATTEWFMKQFVKAGLMRKNRWGQLKVSKSGEESAARVFNALDGTNEDGKAFDKVQLGEYISEHLSNEERDLYFSLRGWLDHMANRQGIQGQQRMSNYATHLFDEAQFAGGARPIEYVGMRVSDEIPTAHLMERLGKTGYKRDLLAMLDSYNRASHRKIIVQPAFEDALAMADDLGRPDVLQYTEDLVNELKGMPRSLDLLTDRMLEGIAARSKDPVMARIAANGSVRTALQVSSLYYSSLLAGNLNYLIQNLGTGVLNPAARFGVMNTAIGMLRMATPEGRTMARESGLDKQWIQIMESEGITKISDVMSKLGPQQSEFYNRGLSFHAALSDAVRRSGRTVEELQAEGLWPAMMADAVKASEFTQFVYGAMGRSPGLSRLFGKAAMTTGTQFLSFPGKQTEFLFALAAENPGYVMRYFAYSGIMARLAADELGIDASQYTGLGFLPAPSDMRPVPLSPAVGTLMSWVDLTGAAAKEDLVGMQRHASTVLKGLENIIPGAKILTRGMKAAHELETGKITSPTTGQLVREKQFPEETLSTILQTPSVQDREARSFEHQFRQRRDTKMFELQQLGQDAVRAYESGDMSGMGDALAKLAQQGIMVSPNTFMRVLEAQHLSRRARQLKADPYFLPPELLKGVNWQDEIIEPQD